MLLLFPLLLLLSPLAPRPAHASPVGDPAPAIEAKEWVGEPLDWKKVRGRVIYILFVKFRDPDSEAALKDVGEMLKKRAKDGLEPLLVAEYPRKNEVDLWARSVVRGQNFRIAMEENSQVSAAYIAQVNPHAVVVDRDAKIVFEGHPCRERIAVAQAVDDALAKAPTIARGKTSKRLGPAWQAMDGTDWRTAIKELVAIRDDPAADPEDAGNARGMLLMIQKEGEKALVAAERLLTAEEYADALAGFEEAAGVFAGLPPAEQAAKKADELKKDKKLKKELEAGEALREARRLDNAGERAAAIAKYKAIASKWKGTKAADRARRRADELAKSGGK